METKEIANRLVELCRTGQNIQAVQELYAQDIVSVEPKGAPVEVVEGLENVIKKSEQWFSMVEEFHGSEISEPVIAGNHFSCSMKMDVTLKGQGRSSMDEVCVYEVNNGKIVKETFYYSAQ